MGSGKSTAGKKLASRMGFQCIDLDQYIELKSGKSISQIFEDDGENMFRELEKKYLQELAKQTHTIISTGGGTPCFFDNMQWMNSKGTTIYLQMSPASLVHRLQNATSTRPILKNKTNHELLEFVTNALADREKYYLEAQIQAKGENLKITELLEKIKEHRL